MKREIIQEQDVDVRRKQLSEEIRELVDMRAYDALASIIVDLELQLRDALCDLARARAKGFR